MNKNIFFTTMGFLALTGFFSVHASAAVPDKLVILQDENFFLQDENGRLKKALEEKDDAARKVLLDKETLRYNFELLNKEKELFEKKARDLQAELLDRDKDLPQKLELASIPFRLQVTSAQNEVKVLNMALEEKSARLAAVVKEKEDWQAKIDALVGEKLALRESLKKVDEAHKAVQVEADAKVAKEKSFAAAKITDLLARLKAEQSSLQEKSEAGKKPFEERVTVMEGRLKEMDAELKAKDAQAVQELSELKAQYEDKLRKMEQQLAGLRENSGLEVRKVQDALNADIKKLKAQLSTCRQPDISRK